MSGFNIDRYKCTDKELSGEFKFHAPIMYARKRDLYFNSILKKQIEEVPLSREHQDKLKDEECRKYMSELNHSLLKDAIDDALSALKPGEKLMISSYFGLYDEKPKTFEQTGAEFNKSRENTRMTIIHAIKHLKYPFNCRGLVDYYLESINK